MDEGRHKGVTDEWWYFNCHVASKKGDEYGLAVCFFPTYLLDIVVDLRRPSVLHKHGAYGLEFEGSMKKLDIRFGPSWWKQAGDEPGVYLLHYEGEGLKADLEMRSLKPPILVGGGRIRQGLLGESYYYAQTHMKVSGEIALDGRKERVEGKGWIDRQWGIWEWSGLGGWRWFSIQLENGVEILGIQITHPVTGGIIERSFALATREGEAEMLEDVSVAELRRWRSPDTGVVYAIDWDVKASGKFALQLRSVFDSQELSPGLWEGSCTVSGLYGGTRVTGRAFVELSRSRVYGRGSVRAALLALGLVDHLFRRTGVDLNLVYRMLRFLY